MKILCVIPARGNSKRVQNKNIRLLRGKPLIAYTIKSALESELCDKVVVSTNDSKIKVISEKYGCDVIERPNYLSLDTSPIDDSLRHAVRYLEEQENFSPDIVVLLQANVPVRKKGEIDEVIRRLVENEEATAVATGYAVDQRPEWMKIIDERTGMVRPFLGPTRFYRMQDLPKLYLFDGANMTVRKNVLMETEGIVMAHAYLGGNVMLVVHDAKYSVEIDEEKDLELAEFYLSRISDG